MAIVDEVERRQLATIDELVPAASTSFEDAMRTWWQHISDPALWPNERLFFEVYGQALQGRSPANQLLDRIVDSWVDRIASTGEAMGVPREDARAFARLGLAVTRGLLLDLLATEDRAGVDAAMELWIALNAQALIRPTASRR